MIISGLAVTTASSLKNFSLCPGVQIDCSFMFLLVFGVHSKYKNYKFHFGGCKCIKTILYENEADRKGA